MIQQREPMRLVDVSVLMQIPVFAEAAVRKIPEKRQRNVGTVAKEPFSRLDSQKNAIAVEKGRRYGAKDHPHI